MFQSMNVFFKLIKRQILSKFLYTYKIVYSVIFFYILEIKFWLEVLSEFLI